VRAKSQATNETSKFLAVFRHFPARAVLRNKYLIPYPCINRREGVRAIAVPAPPPLGLRPKPARAVFAIRQVSDYRKKS
jgi:hypothetical protein